MFAFNISCIAVMQKYFAQILIFHFTGISYLLVLYVLSCGTSGGNIIKS